MRGSLQLKGQIRSWAESIGRWTDFVKIRERLKADGLDAGECWLRAAQEMDPVMWGQVQSSVKPKRAEKKNDLPRGRSVESDGELRVELDESVGGKVEDKVPLSGNEPAGEPAGDRATKAVFGAKKVSTIKVVEWVASNLQVEDVEPRDAPSSEAWGMLVWARRSPVNESQFWGTIYAKLLPSRSAIEAEQRYADDGSRIEDTAARLLAMRDATESQREAL